MSYLFPEGLTRLTAEMIVKDAELDKLNRGEVLRESAKLLAEHALRKITEDCVKSYDDYIGFKGNVLRLDVYVLSPANLHKQLLDAYTAGQNDRMRFEP